MVANSGRTVVVDTGYWYALFTRGDQHAELAKAKAVHLDSLTILLPWPTLYETINTKFVKNRDGLAGFERMLKGPNVRLIDDTRYRETALEATFQEARRSNRNLSICDMLIRLLIQDIDVRIQALLTFNVRDFHDVCTSRNVEIL